MLSLRYYYNEFILHVYFFFQSHYIADEFSSPNYDEADSSVKMISKRDLEGARAYDDYDSPHKPIYAGKHWKSQLPFQCTCIIILAATSQ